MITLILIRHAKSDWGQPAIGDHDRPLNERGLRDAPVMAERLAAHFADPADPANPADEHGRHRRPDVIVSSTALRAHTTARFFGAALGVEVVTEHRLYGAPPAVLLDVATHVGSAALEDPASANAPDSTVIVVAHDPGLSMLAARLSDGGIDAMPTCAVARFEWDAPDWPSIDFDGADRWHFDAPGRNEPR